MTIRNNGSPEEMAKEFVRNRQARIKNNKSSPNGTSSLLSYLHEQRRETRTH
ncbi:hypothetical protein SAMN05216353_102155 [Halobacillus alkaliphilus]|uniref:Uncharacterized protein n=1 Tax=Halobacillus alkaliphilus TaxID=396056 RepID=A0A1I2JW78_9BACI|nr:hypothetical protein [Halobacillus alkaliphilus]SFF58130.1 hypothetical protein SAMN05216353_102155 [Halobacillus alkaliphilus]